MSDHDSLTARLAVQRLAMPGVLDRTPVQRRYERLQQGTVKHDLTAQLHRRAMASGEAGGGSFVWRRSLEPASPSPEGLPVPAAATSVQAASTTAPISRTDSPVVQRATLPEAESAALAERLTSRAQSPGLLAMGTTISRPAATGSFSNAPAFAARLQSRYGATSSEAAAAAAPVLAAPAPAISRAPANVVRRQVDAATTTLPPSSHDAVTLVPASSPVSRGIVAAPMLARKTSTDSAMARAVPPAGPLPGNSSLAAPDLPTGDPPRVPGIPVMPPAYPLVSPASAPGAPLVLRRMLAAPAQSSTPFSLVTPPPTVQQPREETPLPHKPDPAVTARAGSGTGSDIDRIAEEVGRRLMRRLEIERERKGIRQWR